MTGLDGTGPDMTGLDGTGPDMTGLDETGQDTTRLDETGQDTTRRDPSLRKVFPMLRNKDIAYLLSTFCGLSKKKGTEVVAKVFEIISSHMIHAPIAKCTIREFGRIWAVDTPERIGKNPRTKETIVIPARRHVKFKACPGLRRAINGK